MILQKVSFQLCGQGCCPLFKFDLFDFSNKINSDRQYGWLAQQRIPDENMTFFEHNI